MIGVTVAFFKTETLDLIQACVAEVGIVAHFTEEPGLFVSNKPRDMILAWKPWSLLT